MKRILTYLLAVTFLLPGFFCSVSKNKSHESLEVVKIQRTGILVAEGDGIQVVARRPYIRRGEIGVLALKCTPGSNCRIIASYKINGRNYSTVRNLVAGRDGNILCTWKVDEKTDTGTYNIEITSGANRLVTTYTVQ